MLISISFYQFTLREPFAEGMRLSSAEARALNALRAENIRNIAGKFLRKTGANQRLLSPVELERLEAEVRRLDERYQFSLPITRSKSGTLQAIARDVAEEMLSVSNHKEGRAMTQSQFASTAARLAQSSEVLAIAKQRIEQKLAVASASLEDLFSTDESASEAAE